MGYAHINNLYRDKTILQFKECYALEKIHGSSAHVSYKSDRDPKLTFFAGGTSHESFLKIFQNHERLIEYFEHLGHSDVTVFGEVYGGKMQGMSSTYGKELKFVAFEVRVGDVWLNVPNAHDVTYKLGLEFVDYARIPTDLDRIDAERDRDSSQALRNGMGPGHKREGVVLRPLEEYTTPGGHRVVCKHKRDEFMETKTPRTVSEEKLKVLADAQAVAHEWVTEMRLTHVLDKIPGHSIERMKDIIEAMVEDVMREGADEIVDSREVRSTIGKATAQLYKQMLRDHLNSSTVL
jgi:hypothetical protein